MATGLHKKEDLTVDLTGSEITSASDTAVISESDVSSFVSSVESKVTSSKVTSSKATSSVTSTVQKLDSTKIYNTNQNIADNLFLDALVYTGYNLAKHKADGNMWNYITWDRKAGLGYLSKITYGGGSTGYETNSKGLPDISYFEKHGLVCASYVTYVYFNYLPHVAGIDTSMLTKPSDPKSANAWYLAVKDWVKKGYSKEVKFTATAPAMKACFIKFNNSTEMPIGSVVIFRDASKSSDYGGHVAIYTGYKNGYHWLHHVGNKNGPEMCAIERMLFGPDPQWPIYIVTPPTSIRFSAMISVDLKDNDGKPVEGATLRLKNKKTGAVTELGKTDKNGHLEKENLNYGEYILSGATPEGYESLADKTVALTSANNSKTDVKITVKKTKKTSKNEESQ